MTKLNLGSGIYYKPGYINVDFSDESIADIQADITQLPYENNSVAEIEASHIIEHFSNEVIPFLLSEWYRVLQPTGRLCIETPHLLKVANKIAQKDMHDRKSLVRFLFGVDSKGEGNIHKTGFIPHQLKDLLKTVGFQDIHQEQPSSFKDQPGFRLTCIKPDESERKPMTHFLTTFRWRLLKEFPLTNWDSYFYAALEKNCFGALNAIISSTSRGKDFFTSDKFIELCATFAIFQPKAARCFLSLFSKKRLKNVNTEFLQYMSKQNVTQYLVKNWSNWKKDPNNQGKAIIQFYSHWIKKISYHLRKQNNSDYSEDFAYLFSRDPTDANYFDFDLMSQQGQKLFNKGIQAFSHGKLEQATALISRALTYDCSYGLGYWNLARILQLKPENNPKTIMKYYTLAKQIIQDKKVKQSIQHEMRNYRRWVKKSVDERTYELQPVQIRY